MVNDNDNENDNFQAAHGGVIDRINYQLSIPAGQQLSIVNYQFSIE